MAEPASEALFYAAGPGGQEGPMLADELVGAVATGRLPEGVLVWWPEAEGWVAFEQQPQLSAQLAAKRAPSGGPSAPPAPAPPPPAAAQDSQEDEWVDVGTDEAASITREQIAAADAADADDERLRVASAGPAASDDQLDKIFAGLVKDSWRYHHLLDDTARVDEVFVGALITSTLETGLALIDLTSDGTNHFLRFEHPEDRSRVSMAITHLTPAVTTAAAVGQRASVVFGYGEPLKSFAKVFSAMRQEAKSGYLATTEPGVVSFDADSESHYLYTTVPMFMDLDKYISREFKVDYGKLSEHVAATVHALRKFLRGRVDEEKS